MNSPIRNHVAALFLMLPIALTVAALPTAATAQQNGPEVASLQISASRGLDTGSRLNITLKGTPRSQVSVRIHGVKQNISLWETSHGVYTAGYVVKSGDRLDDDANVRATLRNRNRSARANYTVTETMLRAPIAVATAPVAVPLPPRIDRFQAVTIERLEPGAELRFSLEAAPGATVLVDLPGITADVALREIRPGHYEGSYTLRRSDNLDLSRPIVATLRAGDRVVTANLAQPLVQQATDSRAPMIGNLMPRDGEMVMGAPNTHISASFSDRGGSGVDPASVRVTLSGRNITPESQINSQTFNYRSHLPAGRHTVDVSARDQAGNNVRRTWSFEVARGVPANVPITFLNHNNNGPVDGGATLVQARTAPFASVTIKVDAIAPLGGVVNVAQQIHFQTVQADANGNFAFSFSPRIPLPGTRYEISIVSTKENVTQEARMTLFQRQG